MNELKRWTDEGAPEAIERLLQAAESEQPSAASLASALASLGIAGAVTGVASGAAANGIATSGAAASGTAAGGIATSGAAGATVLAGTAGKLSVLALTASLAKWVALGSVVGGAAVVAVDAVSDEAPPATSARPAVVRSAPTSTTAAAVEAPPAIRTPAAPSARNGAAADLLAARPSIARAPVTPAPPPAIPAETLAQEIAGIDRARSLLAAGRYSATIAALDEYERRLPKHHFTPEVLYLRMEAASGAGRTQEARRLAQRLLASYPTSLQSERAKQLLDR